MIIPGWLEVVQIIIDTPDTALSKPIVVRLTVSPASPGHVGPVSPLPAGQLSVVCSKVSEGSQPEGGAQGVVLNKLILVQRIDGRQAGVAVKFAALLLCLTPCHPILRWSKVITGLVPQLPPKRTI